MFAVQAAEHSVLAQQQQFTGSEIDYRWAFQQQKFAQAQLPVLIFHDHIAYPLTVFIQDAPVAAVAFFVDRR